jgi:hypothetical protein
MKLLHQEPANVPASKPSATWPFKISSSYVGALTPTRKRSIRRMKEADHVA